MRRIDLIPAAVWLALAASGCAASSSMGGAPRPDAFSMSGTDSLEAAQYERIFVETHARLIREINTEAKSELDGATLLEIRSIVEIAEEFYLQGNPLLAVKLLTEAEMLLRQTP